MSFAFFLIIKLLIFSLHNLLSLNSHFLPSFFKISLFFKTLNSLIVLKYRVVFGLVFFKFSNFGFYMLYFYVKSMCLCLCVSSLFNLYLIIKQNAELLLCMTSLSLFSSLSSGRRATYFCFILFLRSLKVSPICEWLWKGSKGQQQFGLFKTHVKCLSKIKRLFSQVELPDLQKSPQSTLGYRLSSVSCWIIGKGLWFGFIEMKGRENLLESPVFRYRETQA